jgi:hypothetical protein
MEYHVMEYVNLYDYCDPKHLVLTAVKNNIDEAYWKMLTPGGFRVPFNQELPISSKDDTLYLCNTTPEGSIYWVAELQHYFKTPGFSFPNPGGAGRVSQSCLILHGTSITWVVS